MRTQEDRVVVHCLRDRPSNRKIEEKRKKKVIDILKQEVYRGFGPALAEEYLKALRHRWRYFMVRLVKLTGRLLVWGKRPLLASRSFCSPMCSPEWIVFVPIRAFAACWPG